MRRNIFVLIVSLLVLILSVMSASAFWPFDGIGLSPSCQKCDLTIAGDANNDCNMDVSDVVFITQYLQGKQSFCNGQSYYVSADVNGDRVIDETDSTYLFNYLGGGPAPVSISNLACSDYGYNDGFVGACCDNLCSRVDLSNCLNVSRSCTDPDRNSETKEVREGSSGAIGGVNIVVTNADETNLALNVNLRAFPLNSGTIVEFSLSDKIPKKEVQIGGATYIIELISASDTSATIKVSDSGLNYFNYSRVSFGSGEIRGPSCSSNSAPGIGGGGISADRCDGSFVVEQICNIDNTVGAIRYECANGCASGACLSTTPTPVPNQTSVCIDSDGKIETKEISEGSEMNIAGLNVRVLEDDKSSATLNVKLRVVPIDSSFEAVEVDFSSSKLSAEVKFGGVNYFITLIGVRLIGVANSATIKVNSGLNYNTYGQVTKGNLVFNDRCEDNTLKEYFCQSTKEEGFVKTECGNGCFDGKCRESSIVKPTQSAVLNAPFSIVDFSVNRDKNNVEIEFKNGAGETLVISEFELEVTSGAEGCTLTSGLGNIENQRTMKAVLQCDGLDSSKEDFRADILVEYKKLNSDLLLVSAGQIVDRLPSHAKVCQELSAKLEVLDLTNEGYSFEEKGADDEVGEYGGNINIYEYKNKDKTKELFIVHAVLDKDVKDTGLLDLIKEFGLLSGDYIYTDKAQQVYVLQQDFEDSKILLWYNDNVLVYIALGKTGFDYNKIIGNTEEFISNLKNNEFKSVVDYSDADYRTVYRIASQLLNYCSSDVEEQCLPQWEQKLEPVVCPPHGVQNVIIRDRNRCDNRVIQENRYCSPGICSGCYVPRWIGYGNTGDNVCIPYGIRIANEQTDRERLRVSDSDKDAVLRCVDENSAEVTIINPRTNFEQTLELNERESYTISEEYFGEEIRFRVDKISCSGADDSNGYVDITALDEFNAYCDISGRVERQRTKDAVGNWAKCQNNYECDSNLCSGGECVEINDAIRKAGSIKGLVFRVLCRLAHLFNEDTYSSCVGNYLGYTGTA